MSHNPDDKRMTHRQLAEMMVNGWGEWMHNPLHSGVVYTTYKYLDVEGDWPLGKNSDGQDIVVRAFGETNWQFPTKEVYEKALMKNRLKNIMGF